jgi:hypothetical protein
VLPIFSNQKQTPHTLWGITTGGETKMADATEAIRREMVGAINSSVPAGATAETERERLEKIHGRVWGIAELSEDFSVEGFMAPFIVVTEKATGKKGTLMFQHSPRFYFDFNPAD